MMMRGRFAPSPSGKMHIGNAGCALLSWLQVRKAGGSFILRIEDIDRGRSRVEYIKQLIEDLKWLGLDWDEGPDCGGPFGPYIQSARTELYEEAFDQLKEKGHLFPCFCSRKDLKMLASAPHGRDSEGPVYPGICRHLPEEEQAVKTRIKTPSWRYNTESVRAVQFTDLVLGDQYFPAGFGGDFVVKRADGLFSYQLAVVVDDALMGITHVTRGMDLLDSTPRQIWLYEALGHAAPCFSHIPLLFGPDGTRLSKRHGADITIEALRKAGARPEAVIGYLAFLYRIIDRFEPLKPTELIPLFHLTKIPKAHLVVEDLKQISSLKLS